MDVTQFNNERLKTMINQSYNFNEELVQNLSSEIQKRALMSAFEIDKLLEKAVIIKAERKEKARQENIKLFKKQERANKMYAYVTLGLLITSVLIFIYTKWIFILTLSPAFFGGSKAYRRNRYGR